MTVPVNAVDGSDSFETKPFQVDLRGVIDLLSRHIYSSPQVFLRELLQNGRDAITARALFTTEGGIPTDSQPGGSIRITPVSSTNATFVFSDNGIGLTVDEVNDLLATVGRSSKRDIFDLPRSDFLGQFGIGLLSCFMVSDNILIRSRSAKGGVGVEWCGSAEGTFTVRELDESATHAMQVGTEVHLTPRADELTLLETKSVVNLATQYGQFLDISVHVTLPGGGSEAINRDPVFIHPPDVPPSAELLDYGRELIGATPFDAFSIAAPGTQTRGTAFVLPYAPPPGAKHANRVYLGRMLLSERAEDILPSWAFFVRACIDTEGLTPTASREQLVENEALEFTREQLGAGIRRWIMQLALTAPSRLAEFVALHEVALKSLVVFDDELAPFIVRWLRLETSNGPVTVENLVGHGAHIRYTETIDEFRQISGIARADSPIVNGGYLYDSEIIRSLPALCSNVTVERITVSGELDHLDPPPLDDRAESIKLEERATAVLATVNTAVSVRAFTPEDLPGLYVLDPYVLRSLERGAAKDISSPLWSGMLQKVDQHFESMQQGEDKKSTLAHLCLNWNSRLVRLLVRVTDEAVFSRSIHLVYVQALLAGHRPLRAADRKMLTQALSDLVHLSVGVTEGDFL